MWVEARDIMVCDHKMTQWGRGDAQACVLGQLDAGRRRFAKRAVKSTWCTTWFNIATNKGISKETISCVS